VNRRKTGIVERVCTVAPDGFGEFFLASAGAGGAFVGLLFVAISISPQVTFGDPAVNGALRQRLAEGTFLTLVNGFVVSSIALIPSINVGWVAFVLGFAGVLTAAHLGWLFVNFHWHGARTVRQELHLPRSVSLSLIATVIYAIEAVLGLRLILQSADRNPFAWLAVIITSLYALGIFRAWALLGDLRYGWSSWLNPLQDRAPIRNEVSGDVAETRIETMPQTGTKEVRFQRPDRRSNSL